MLNKENKTTDINTSPFEGGEELIKTEQIGNFILCERDKTYWAAIGNYRVTEFNTSKEHILNMIEEYGQLMLNIAAALIQLNEELNNKKQKH